MKSTKHIEPKRKPRYDYIEARKLYESHRESLRLTDQSWGYRYVLPAIASVIVGIDVYVLAINIYLGRLPSDSPLLFAVMVTTAVFFIGMLVGHSIYQRRCVALLQRAEIDVPERDPEPSFITLCQERKELRQHRMKSHHKSWQLVRFALPVIVASAFIALIYFLPNSTFPAKTLGSQLVIASMLFVLIWSYLTVGLELVYLTKLWRQVHLDK